MRVIHEVPKVRRVRLKASSRNGLHPGGRLLLLRKGVRSESTLTRVRDRGRGRGWKGHRWKGKTVVRVSSIRTATSSACEDFCGASRFVSWWHRRAAVFIKPALSLTVLIFRSTFLATFRRTCFALSLLGRGSGQRLCRTFDNLFDWCRARQWRTVFRKSTPLSQSEIPRFGNQFIRPSSPDFRNASSSRELTLRTANLPSLRGESGVQPSLP